MDSATTSGNAQQQPTDKKLINLTLVNGTGYVFDADDYMELRKKHRILGAFVGSTSGNGDALPVALTQWETRLLVEENIAQLLSKESGLSEAPTAEQLALHAQKLTELAAEQKEAYKQKKLQDIQRHMPQILAGKRRKLQEANNPQAAESLTEEDILKSAEDNFVFDEKHLLRELHTAHPFAHTAYLCELEEDRSLLYCVFRDCYQRGFFVMPGEQFGADLLLYPGDPLVYHASHLVILLETKGVVDALELIAKTRIAVTVNKICVFAYFASNVEKEASNWPKIQYQSVEWLGDLDADAESKRTQKKTVN